MVQLKYHQFNINGIAIIVIVLSVIIESLPFGFDCRLIKVKKEHLFLRLWHGQYLTTSGLVLIK